MVTFGEFKEILECIMQEDKLQDTLLEYGIDCIYMPSNTIKDYVVRLLSRLLKDEHFTIAWWCWETDFGRNKELCQLTDTETQKSVFIDTIEKLWLLLTNEEELWKRAE